MKIFCKIIWNWLNNHTDDKIGFFLCEIKLFQIGNSDIAPSFTVVERPNDWTKEIRKTTATNPTQQQRLEYWQAFNDYAFQNAEFNKAFNKRKPTTDHWMDFSIGSSACHIAVSQIQKRNAIDVEVYINDDKELFRSLFLHKDDIVGDSHQRIYRNKAVLSKCGINVRGRSSYLRINYRTTEEIRKFAFSLLNGVSFDDLDEDYDNGKGCQSLTHGDKPEIKEFATPEKELDYLVSRIHELETAGIEQKNICIVARTHKLLDSYIAGLQRAGIKSFEIKANKTDDRTFEGVRMATMHRVKGLEFDYVFAVAVNKKVLPFGTRADFEDDISLEEFRTGEKCLLYVALTRARKSACVTCYGGLSELIV